MADAMRLQFPLIGSPIMRAVMTVALAGLAVLGNHFHLPLFFGVDFIFGSIAALLALSLLGLVPALIVAAAGGAYTLLLWGHPYALLILVLEPLAVHVLQRRVSHLALADALYWLLLGIPLVMLVYPWVLDMGLHQAWFVSLKQTLNGIFNAVITSLLMLGLLSLRNRRADDAFQRIPIASLLFNALLAMTLLAGMLPVVLDSHSRHQELESDLNARLGRVGERILAHLEMAPTAQLETAPLPEDMVAAVVAADGRILAERGTLYSLHDMGTLTAVSGGAHIWLPGGEMAAMLRWYKGQYVRDFPLTTGSSARLVIEQAAAPLVARLEQQRLNSLSVLAVVTLAAVLLAMLLSRWLSRPIRHLEVLSRDLSIRIAAGVSTTIKGSRVTEYDSLAGSIRAMAETLSTSFRAIHDMRDTLEQRVQERTAELLRREAMLAESEARFRNMADAAPALIWLSDTGNLGIWYNTRWLEYTGRSLEQELGLGWAAGVHPEDLDRCVAYCNAAFAARRPFEMEFRLRRADGDYGWIVDTGIPRFNAAGEFEGYIGYCWDITDRKQAELALRRQQRLGEVIARAQLQFIREADRHAAFDGLLVDILALTESEYGFIGEILHGADGQPYLKTHAISDIAWDNATRAFYEQHAPEGMEFRNLDTLFGAAITSGEPVVANDPANDPRRGGLPPGHPLLDTFLGVPIRAGDELVAMLGIANRAVGYDAALIEFLHPLLTTIGQLVEALCHQRRRQEDQAQLRDSERRLAAVIEGTHIGTWEWNVRTGATVFNERWAGIVGYTLAELAPVSIQTWLDLAHPDDLQRSGELLERHFAGELPYYDLQCRMRHKDGHWVWVHDRGRVVSWTADGKPLMMSGTHADISEQKQAEAALRASEEQYRSLVVNIPGAAYQCALDENWTVLYISDAIEALTGYPATDFIGNAMRSYASVIHPEDTLLGNQAMHDAIKADAAWSIEYRLCHRDGSVRWVYEKGRAMRDDSGAIVCLSGFIHDITERKRMERMKDEFVSTVSHELRTPLTSISGALGLLAGGAVGELPGPVRQMIEIAQKNSQRLMHLINDLLDMEKLAAGKLHFDLQVQELMPLVEQALRENQAYAERFRVRFALIQRCDAVQVRVDALRLQQVLANFLSNAAKFSPEGATVEIAVSRRDASVRVEVIDHGPGIPEAFRRHIFEKFSQADASDARQRGGTGLGLAISKELIEHMHGTVGFASEAGQGARFHIELPVW